MNIDSRIEQIINRLNGTDFYDDPEYTDCKWLISQLRAARKALKQIAKPALGGKQQQWMAQAALQGKQGDNATDGVEVGS